MGFGPPLTRHVDRGVLRHAGQRLVVVGTADFQGLPLENDAIERHGLRGFIHRAELRGGGEEKKASVLAAKPQSAPKMRPPPLLTSRKAKFLSWLICTASTGLPGAWVSPPRRIWALKKSIMAS